MDDEDIGRQHFKTLALDTEFYQSFLDDDGIPEDKKQELIETLWQIVVQFVDLGFGIHPLQQSGHQTENDLHPAISRMIADVAGKEIKTLKKAWPERSEA